MLEMYRLVIARTSRVFTGENELFHSGSGGQIFGGCGSLTLISMYEGLGICWFCVFIIPVRTLDFSS